MSGCRAWSGAVVALGLVCVAGCFSGGSAGAPGLDGNGYRFDFEGEQASRSREGELPADLARVEIRYEFGSVEVRPATDRPHWTWEMTCWAASRDKAEEFAEAIQLTTDVRDGEFQCRLELPEPPVPELRGVRSQLVLHVPADVSVDVANAFGDSSIEGVRGGTVARSRHGKLLLRDLAGPLDASTAHADLIAERIAGGKLTNEHGRLEATQVEGDLEAATSFSELRAASVSGGARLQNEHGRVSARNVGGDLHITTSFAPVEVSELAGKLIARNEHGPVSVSTAAQDVDLATSFSGMDLDGIDGRLVAKNEHGSITGRNIRGNIDARSSFGSIQLDGLSQRVVCRNEHGSIRLTLRSPALERVEAQTSFGELEVRVAAAISPRIEAEADHGQVRSDYPVLRIQPGVDNFGELDAGVARMTLKNEHGSVRVARAAGGQDRE